MTALVVALLAGAFAVGTLLMGWVGVVVVAAAVGVLLHARRRVAGLSALAALLGWLLLLAWTAARGPLLPFAGRLAGAMGVPSFAPLVLTLVFPMVLAWSAAAVGQGVRSMILREGRTEGA